VKLNNKGAAMALQVSINEKIQNMIEEIPHDGRDGLTREHARFIANMMLMINESTGCAVFQKADIEHVKFMRKWFMRCMAGVGIAVTAGIGIIVTSLFNKAFWMKILGITLK
jgi:hypothetical protein